MLLDHPSPNHGPRPQGMRVDMLVLHYTGMRSAEEALSRLCAEGGDEAAQVSAHYLIDEAGGCIRLVEEGRRAWHAGRALWAGVRDVNGCSIGIELVNPGHEFGYRRFPGPQMAALEVLAREILARHPIPSHRVLGHSDVAPERKEDPGELFDWQGLAAAGIGLWPAITAPPDGWEAGGPDDMRRDLARFGYGIAPEGGMDAALRAVILAFQRHWLPGNLTGALDPATCWRLRQMLELVG